MLRMLLRNLVENAHRYSPQGSNIMIKLQEDGGAVMAVEDEGPGIDESKCGELSKAFVRMDSRYGGGWVGVRIFRPLLQVDHRGVFLSKPQKKSGARGRGWLLYTSYAAGRKQGGGLYWRCGFLQKKKIEPDRVRALSSYQ
ncbi:ATP-binding protein [Escherichia coli]|nr:ATP-binding protein [Escherichia coli]